MVNTRGTSVDPNPPNRGTIPDPRSIASESQSDTRSEKGSLSSCSLCGSLDVYQWYVGLRCAECAEITPRQSVVRRSVFNRRFPLGDENYHVLENILNLKQDSPVHEAFYHSGIDHPSDLAIFNLFTGPTKILRYE